MRDGVDQLIKLAEGEKLPPPQIMGGGGRALDQLGGYLFPGFFVILIAGGILRAMLGRFPGSLATGIGMGLVAWLLFGLIIALAVAILAFLLNIINHGVGRGGGWSSGSGGSWGGGSSGGSSSSWGGGGGSFGGGGSSGSW